MAEFRFCSIFNAYKILVSVFYYSVTVHQLYLKHTLKIIDFARFQPIDANF